MSSDSLLKTPSTRLISLDMLRGLTIMAMILVNNPGSWEHIYPPMEHAAWHGCTPTDLIFPFFLFMVGVSMVFSFKKRLVSGVNRNTLLWPIFRRSLILFLIGFFLNAMPNFDFSTVRIPGVLQRIAVCYLLAALILLYTKPKVQAAIGIGLLVVYWVGVKWIPVPGYGAGILEAEGSFVHYVDKMLLAGHTWKWAPAAGFDPEGIWSSLSAVSTVILGAFTGYLMSSPRKAYLKLTGLFVGANFSLLLGYVLTIWMPWNKNLWTVSYVFVTAGWAMHFLGMCYWLVDVRGHTGLAKPFIIFGSNAIIVYALSSAVAKLVYLAQITTSAGTISLKTWLYQHLFASWAGELNGSLLYPISYLLIWFLVAWLLYRKRIFIKV